MVPNSAASASRLPAAANSEPDPGPVYIRAELISGRGEIHCVTAPYLACVVNHSALAAKCRLVRVVEIQDQKCSESA